MNKFTQGSAYVSNSEETICTLVSHQAQKHPQRVAVIDGQLEIDYSHLMARANTIARELAVRGVASGSLVGVCMERSWELVATLLGVLRAGCAYVPLDPTYPQQRIRYMLEHSRAAAAIVQNKDLAKLCDGVDELIWLDDVCERVFDGVFGPTSDALAYVIYTSGSTGQPKGVAVEHKSVVALSDSMRELLNDDELNGVLASTSVCFDPSVMEILGTLSLGGTVVMAKNILELPQLPSAEKVATCITVPSAMQVLLSSGQLPQNIRCLVFGGEMLKRSLVEQLHQFNPQLRVLNVYGPTEDTVYSTVNEVQAGEGAITIGKSITNSRAYILDESMRPVAAGVAGELYLAGDKLARGYLFDEELSKRRFIEVGQCEAFVRERLYRTGDLCQFRACGEIEFLGRVDQQVKIRGFRIELEEIESVLESMPGVDAAAAAALDGGVGQKILVMYVVSHNDAVTDTAVKSYLVERLPGYMVPQVVMHLNELPYLPNGKLDRKQLPKLEQMLHGEHGLADGAKQEQQTAILSIVRSEVAALINFSDPEQTSPNHSFDSLGLDSLTGVELASRLSKQLGTIVPAQAIFEHSTLSTLVAFVHNLIDDEIEHTPIKQAKNAAANTLADFQANIQSSHPTFQAAKATAWSATDKGKLVQQVMQMVNDQRRNPYSKVLRTGSGTKGTVADAHTNEEREAIIWTTNLYLGLNRDEHVIEQACTAVQRFGSGMGTSAAASGLTDLHLQFESAFAELVGKQAACLFPTGYTANIGAVAGLLDENDVIVIDQLCHASIVDGARLSGSTIRTFQHNNPADLETVLASEVSPYRTVMVVIEGVYSMGEGAAPVAEIVRMAKKYDALILVDEAHSFGFYGKHGAGICAAQGVTEEVDFIMTTLSKSLGSLGGVIAAKQAHIDLLKSSSRAYIFQASVSPADIAAALTSLKRISTDDSLRERLWNTAGYMREQFSEAGYDLGTGDGPIVTPHFCDKDKLYAIVQGLYRRGVQTSAVTYPIVERGRGRLRFICSAAHTKQDVDKTLQALIEAEREADAQLATVDNVAAGLTLGVALIENWAHGFTDYLQHAMANTTRPMPELAITVAIAEHETPVTLVIKDKRAMVSNDCVKDMMSCSLLLTDDNAVSGLCSGDVQALLHSICNGTCVLNGQVEPFIWFIARMAER